MHNLLAIFLIYILSSWAFINAQTTDPKDTEVWNPVPKMIAPGVGTAPPSDAIVLFDGKDLSNWVSAGGTPAAWTLSDGVITVKPGTGDIFTRRSFGDIQLHLEWRSPAKVENEGQDRGNSGVFFQSRYEVQVLDNFQNKTYPNGQAGAVYKQHIPLVNACRPPGEWQTYDIVFTAPRFNKDGIKIRSGYLTVFHNGILIQNHVEIKGTAENVGMPKNIAHGHASLQLQDHDCHVSFRNIWVREL